MGFKYESIFFKEKYWLALVSSEQINFLSKVTLLIV